MKKLLLIGGGIVVIAIAALTIFGSDTVGFFIKKGIEDKGSEMLGVAVTVEKVEISFTGIGKIKNLQIANCEGLTSEYLFKTNTLDIEIDPDTIETQKIHIKKLVIDAPEIVFEGDILNNNMKQIQENIQKNKKEEEKEQKKVQLDYLRIQNAKVSAHLKGMAKKQFNLKNIELKNIGKDSSTNMRDLYQQIIEQVRKRIIDNLKEKKIEDFPKVPFIKNKRKPKNLPRPPFGK